ncbi:hypothetical protein ANCCAN_14016 [Ancylostoma caninum]|nr:hypothetical protein ANCCAN_14016 [Ancylostoma caninum]
MGAKSKYVIVQLASVITGSTRVWRGGCSPLVVTEAEVMGAKSKYVIVQLASVITGSTRVWVRERAAEKFSGIFHDPALGRSCLFEEARRIKGKNDLPKRVKAMYNIGN